MQIFERRNGRKIEKDGKNEKGGALAPCHGRNPTRRDVAEH